MGLRTLPLSVDGGFAVRRFSTRNWIWEDQPCRSNSPGTTNKSLAVDVCGILPIPPSQYHDCEGMLPHAETDNPATHLSGILHTIPSHHACTRPIQILPRKLMTKARSKRSSASIESLVAQMQSRLQQQSRTWPQVSSNNRIKPDTNSPVRSNKAVGGPRGSSNNRIKPYTNSPVCSLNKARGGPQGSSNKNETKLESNLEHSCIASSYRTAWSHSPIFA